MQRRSARKRVVRRECGSQDRRTDRGCSQDRTEQSFLEPAGCGWNGVGPRTCGRGASAQGCELPFVEGDAGAAQHSGAQVCAAPFDDGQRADGIRVGHAASEPMQPYSRRFEEACAEKAVPAHD